MPLLTLRPLPSAAMPRAGSPKVTGVFAPRLVATRLIATGICALGLFSAAAPAAAQSASAGDSGGDKVNMVIIYGEDSCPQSSADEITVCARKPESERYRIPEPFRNSTSREDESWTNRVTAYETVGATGTNSCSPVGTGGWTGCSQQLIHNAYAEKKASPDVQFSKMIDEARQKRLSTIDADSARQQADVEQAEKEYEARQRARQDPEAGDATVTGPSATAPGATAPASAAPASGAGAASGTAPATPQPPADGTGK